MKRKSGFTLLEVVIALAIVAVALSAAMRAGAVSIDSAVKLKTHMYATWVAQNRLALQEASGKSKERTDNGKTVMGGINFYWEEKLTKVDAKSKLKLMEITVSTSVIHDYIVADLTAYVL